MKKIYFASPLGFSESTRPFLESVTREIAKCGYTVLNPWTLTSTEEVSAALSTQGSERKGAIQKLNYNIGHRNREAIDLCDGVFAILDGAEVDSGTASEVGYAAAKGKPILGYRNDFRLCGDNEEAVVNIQLEYFIKMNGGSIIRNIRELEVGLERIFEKYPT